MRKLELSFLEWMRALWCSFGSLRASCSAVWLDRSLHSGLVAKHQCEEESLDVRGVSVLKKTERLCPVCACNPLVSPAL